MSGKQFVIVDKEFKKENIYFGDVESKKKIPNSKTYRAAVGYKGMPKSYVTCIPKGGKTRRDDKEALVVLFKGTGHGFHTSGVYPTYKYTDPRKGKTPKIPENITGYQLLINLQSKDSLENPTKDDLIGVNVYESLTDALKDFVVENQESLPALYRTLSPKALRKCVVPLHQPTKTTEEGNTYGPSHFARIGYWGPNVYKGKSYPERFTTPFKAPKGATDEDGNPIKKYNPKDLQGTHGDVVYALRIHHVNFITEDEENLKIKFVADLADVNFTPTTQAEESNFCGDNDRELSSDQEVEKQGYGDVDPTKEYGDGASDSYGDDSSSGEEKKKSKKEKKKSKK
jgi:hypothetical protein